MNPFFGCSFEKNFIVMMSNGADKTYRHLPVSFIMFNLGIQESMKSIMNQLVNIGMFLIPGQEFTERSQETVRVGEVIQ